MESVCRVCGFDEGEDRWQPDGPGYDICSCCAAESGVDDRTKADALRYRNAWVAAGMPWFAPDERPAQWSGESQLRDVPAAWRYPSRRELT